MCEPQIAIVSLTITEKGYFHSPATGQLMLDHPMVAADVQNPHQPKTRPTSKNPSDYQAGDIVSWRLDNGLAHIGVVSDGFARDGTPLVIHNIGAGAQEEDVLFNWRMVGHYRYFVK